MSKEAMKAKRSHAEILVKYGHPDAQIYAHTAHLKKAPHFQNEMRLDT
jgi:hypothetical protein